MKNEKFDLFALCFFVLCFTMYGCMADTNATSISIPVTRSTLDSILNVPTPSIFPAFILNLSPKPSTKIPLDVFIKGSYSGQPVFSMNWENNDTLGYDASVCVKYNLTPLILNSPDLSIKYRTMLVDGRTVSRNGEFTTDMLCEHVFPDGTTKPWDCNDHAVCWQSPFNVGVHEATFQVHLRPGGIEEYTWYYEVVEPVASPTP